MKEKISNKNAFCNNVHGLVYTVLASINNTAYLALDDSFRMLEKSGYFRHAVKYNAKKAIADCKRYESRLQRHLDALGGKSGLWLAMQCSVEDGIKHDIDIFRICIDQVLTKNGEKYSSLKASMIAARALTDFAVKMYDDLFDKVKEKTGYDFREYYTGMRLTDVKHSWGVACDGMMSGEKRRIELNGIKDCSDAFGIIARKLTSQSFMDATGDTALHDFPQFTTPEELAELDKNIEKYG